MKKFINILLVIIFFAGLGIVLYPTISNYVNSKTQSRAVAGYSESLTQFTKEDFSSLWEAAEEYNEELTAHPGFGSLSEAKKEQYYDMLRVPTTDVMGYIDIPKLNVHLPIYHGTSEGVLQIGVGHVEDSSLPTGGIGTHSVLSGHRGLPSSMLFTDLDRMEEGDEFYISVLDREMRYEVDQISIVLPNDTRELNRDPEKDYCTLFTCTPYGINSHRLLVRGVRADINTETEHIISADALTVDPLTVAPLIAVPIILILLIALFFNPGRRKKSTDMEKIYGELNRELSEKSNTESNAGSSVNSSRDSSKESSNVSGKDSCKDSAKETNKESHKETTED